MQLMIVILLIFSIAIPLWLAAMVWRVDKPDWVSWLVAITPHVMFFIVILVVARWDISGIWTPWALCAAMAASVVWSAYRHRKSPWVNERLRLSDIWGQTIPVAIYAAILGYVLSGFLAASRPHDLAFPLRGGNFVIAQGGGNRLLNYHSPHASQHFASDITAVGPMGFRASGLQPRDPEKYTIFGADVVSPCDGVVAEAADGLIDQPPPDRNREEPAGNHVVITCEGVRVELAHLLEGSVVPTAGDTLRTGELLGKVGNSGNTTEPHLHIHAVNPETNKGVLLSFDGRIPIRNRRFRR